MHSSNKEKKTRNGALRLLSAIFVVLLALSVGPTTVRAQEESPSPSPLNDEVKKLQEKIDILEKQKKIAELEKDKAVAERAKLDAMLPKSSATPLQGKTTVDDKVVLESQILAYKALSEISNNISDRIKLVSPKPDVLIIYNERDINSLQAYNTAKGQIDATLVRYRALLPAGAQEAGPASLLLSPEVATSVVKSVIDLVSLFRTDTEIKGLSFTVDEEALVSRISKGLQNSGIPVYYPLIYPPRLLSAGDSELIKALSDLYVEKSKAELVITRCESSDKTEKEQCLNSYGNVLPQLKALNAQVDKFLGDLLRIDETAKTNTLASLIRAEGLKKSLDADNSCVLQLKIWTAAGSNKTTRNLFTGSKLYHSGGTIVSYILFDKNGSIRLSDTLYNYDGFVQVKTKNGNLGNNLEQ